MSCKKQHNIFKLKSLACWIRFDYGCSFLRLPISHPPNTYRSTPMSQESLLSAYQEQVPEGFALTTSTLPGPQVNCLGDVVKEQAAAEQGLHFLNWQDVMLSD